MSAFFQWKNSSLLEGEMELVAEACEVFYGWVENPALSHSVISQRALQCEGLGALTGTPELYGLSSLGWEKGAGVHTTRFIEDKDGWGSCQLCSLVRTQRKCLLHMQEVGLGGEMRKVLAAEQGGTSPSPQGGGKNPDEWTLLGLGCLCMIKWGTDLPSFSFCEENWDKAGHCLAQKGLFNESLRLFSYVRFPGLGICQVPRTARHHLNIQWHLERGRVIHRWIKIKHQEKK